MKSINNHNIMDILAQNVTNYRKSLHYSQEQLAEKANISVQTIRNIETARKWVSHSTVSTLSKSLNILEYQLFVPDKFYKDKKLKKPSFTNLLSIKNSFKKEFLSLLNKTFENLIKTGNFSLF